MSLRTTARLTGAFWVIVFIAGSVALGVPRGPLLAALNRVATLSYVAVTILLYQLLKSVNRTIARGALVAGLAGCTISLFNLSSVLHVRDLVLFGVQCLLVGYLIFESTFLPRFLGGLMTIAGLGWLTFAWPSLAAALTPYNLIPGMIGEGVTLLWLLAKGVNLDRSSEAVA